jgi:tRNA-specific 2-thiouridylase
MSKQVKTKSIVWIDEQDKTAPIRCMAQNRYRQSDQLCTITHSDKNGASVEFDHPQRAVTPGQSLVFYQNDTCLGGAVIESSI